MARHMTDLERRAFLSEGTRTGILSTTRRDGTPHAAPVWFLLDADGAPDTVVFLTGGDTVKAKTMRRTGIATLTVDEPRPPYSFVTVTGSIKIFDDPHDKLRWSTAIAGRYMGAENAETYGRRNAVPSEILVRLVPDKIVALADIAD